MAAIIVKLTELPDIQAAPISARWVYTSKRAEILKTVREAHHA